MPKKLRSTSSFSLSFLDIMSCGLGAAVLIFLLLKHVTDAPTTVEEKQVMAEISLLEEEIKEGEKTLVRIRNTISDVSYETVTAQGLARKIQEDIDKLKSQIEEINPDSDFDVPGLRSKIARLEAQKEALEKTIPTGNKAYEFTGEGQRQYLTGIPLNGENVLILLDASASMLDETIVNIVRRRNMSDRLKKEAPKWQRTQAIGQWLVANLPLSSDIQVWLFNTEINAADGNELNAWYEATNRADLTRLVQGINKAVPANGTNLAHVFSAAMEMRPRPDNIYLVTDGLPTIGDNSARSGSITGVERYRLFWKAVDKLLPGVRVNTFLLPLEGDPYAAGSYWGLALSTRGSLVTPAADWP